jgi:hypothetical protein
VNALRLLPALLSALALGAHLLRGGHAGLGLVVALLPLLLLARRRWAVVVVQAALALGAVEWLRTLWLLADLRRTHHLPWLRMAIILGAVAGLAALAVPLLGAWSRAVLGHGRETIGGLEVEA